MVKCPQAGAGQALCGRFRGLVPPFVDECRSLYRRSKELSRGSGKTFYLFLMSGRVRVLGLWPGDCRSGWLEVTAGGFRGFHCGHCSERGGGASNAVGVVADAAAGGGVGDAEDDRFHHGEDDGGLAFLLIIGITFCTMTKLNMLRKKSRQGS